MDSIANGEPWHVAVTRRVPFGALAYLGAGTSLTFCFAKTIALYAFPLLGLSTVQFDLNPHLQAVLMWVFVLVGVIGLGLDRPQCGSSIPVVVGVISLIVIVGTLYGVYQVPILMMGYTLLIIAAFLNQSLRLRELNRQVAQQAQSLQSLNATLEQRVELQVSEIENLGRLKRFLAPAVAELLVSHGADSQLNSHRQHIATLFCDMRGFTAFTENIEPEEVMTVLRAYHEEMGRLAAKYEATIDHRAGDGLMLFFNDPIPCDAPELKAVQLAFDMHDAFRRLNERWKKLGYELGFGVGIASGYATMGVVGFEGRYDYTANGSAVNIAARLCDYADDGQTLISRRVYVEVESIVQVSVIEGIALKGLSSEVSAYCVTGLVSPAGA